MRATSGVSKRRLRWGVAEGRGALAVSLKNPQSTDNELVTLSEALECRVDFLKHCIG